MDQTDKAPSLRIEKRNATDIIDQTVDFKQVVGRSQEELPSLEVTLRQGIEAAFSACHSMFTVGPLQTLVTRIAQPLAIAGQWPYYRNLVIWNHARCFWVSVSGIATIRPLVDPLLQRLRHLYVTPISELKPRSVLAG